MSMLLPEQLCPVVTSDKLFLVEGSTIRYYVIYHRCEICAVSYCPDQIIAAESEVDVTNILLQHNTNFTLYYNDYEECCSV